MLKVFFCFPFLNGLAACLDDDPILCGIDENTVLCVIV